MATPPRPTAPVGIPPLSTSGTLPPFVGNDPTIASAMSPYYSSLSETARRFCTSRVRVTIFQGLLQYRQVLASLGFLQGFQWLSGSFVEDIEQLERRDPRDIDLVTFCFPPAHIQTPVDAQALAGANPAVFIPTQAKARFHCDPYFVSLQGASATIVIQTRYWFGLFSHRRGNLWKGLLQVPLPLSQDDVDAQNYVSGLNYP